MSVASLLLFAACLLGAFVLRALHLQVRLHLQVWVVEEPYLRQVHGAAYIAYAASTGRFLPRLGRLHPQQT